jgi:AcrR family transcriptional regulator
MFVEDTMARPDVSEERKQQILQAAARVFVNKGLEAARVEEIAQEAGLSVGGVYWYFKSKEAIIHALLQAMFDADLRGLRNVLAADGTVQTRLTAYVQGGLMAAAAQSPLSNELYSLATRNDAARTHLLAYLGEFQRLLAALLQQGIDRGELRPVAPMTAALTLIAAYEGFTELAMLGLLQPDSEGALLAMLDLLLAGMSQPSAPAMLPAASAPVFSSGKWQSATRL